MAGFAGLSLVVAAALTAVAASPGLNEFLGGLRDYDTAAAGPFDGASARLELVQAPAGATAVLHVSGVDESVAGRTFGAHLHNGACATNDPALSAGHYNRDAHDGHTPVEVSDDTEIWLDVTVTAAGRGTSSAVVRFTPTGGERSVVIHANPTNPATGGAGTKLACLPVAW
jgi:Cu-Zn family superoxide dismutase